MGSCSGLLVPFAGLTVLSPPLCLVQGFSDAQMQHLMSAEELAQERDQEIIHIAQSIEELASIFKELATLVIDQGAFPAVSGPTAAGATDGRCHGAVLCGAVRCCRHHH